MLKFSKATGLSSSVNVSIEEIFVKNGFFAQVVCILFDHLFMCPVDGKIGNATEPLIPVPLSGTNSQ